MSIDISPLLQPIAEHAPCGEDYSFSNEFHLIKKARIEEDSLLDQGDWITERKQADWDLVAKTATLLMREKSKDIRLLSWLTEAWSNQYGFEGISAGLELSHQLLNQYWLALHPEIEEDDLDQRIGLLQGFINQLPQLIKKVPLINHAPFYHLLDYDNVLYQQNIRRKHLDEYEQSESASPLDLFEQALLNTPKSFQYQNYQVFNEILAHWRTLKTVLDELMGLDSPRFASIDSSLNDIDLTLRKIYQADAFATGSHPENLTPTNSGAPMPMETVMAPSLMTTHPAAFQPQVQNHLANREQAMKVLQDIADYFQANEPHSPVSYMLQKTIKWSQMPLHEWLTHVIKEDHPLQMVQETLGVQPKNEYE